MNPTTTREAAPAVNLALKYRELLGRPILAIERGEKRPLGSWKDHQGGQTEDELRAQPWSDAGGLGCVTGDGLICLDMDNAEAFALETALEALGLPRDYPWSVKTPGGGFHVWLRCSGLEVGKWEGPFPGSAHIELRGKGHQTLLPTSRHPSGGRYEFAHGPMPLTPPALVTAEALRSLTNWKQLQGSTREEAKTSTLSYPPPESSRARAYVTAALEDEYQKVREAPQGRRNELLNEAAFSLGQLAGVGAEESDVEAALISAAIVAGLPEHEARRTFRSGWQAGLENPRGIPEHDPATVAPATPPQGPAAATVYPLTDLGNGERLAAFYGDQLRYEKASNRWYHWSGQRWERDDALAVEAFAARTARMIYEEAGRETDLEKRRDLAKHARASESRQRQQAMVASAHHMLTIEPRQWDRDPWLLNVANGTIDLRTGELQPHRQGDLITMLAPVEYDPEAEARLFLTFLEQVQPDGEIRGFLQRSVGYGLTGVIRQQHFWFCIGVGANGKGTLLNTVLAIVGDYAKQAPPDLFIRDKSRHPTELAFLRGARLMVATETQEGSRMDESKVKQLTGGDMITARFIGGDFFTFAPSHKLWLQGNHKPRISGTDHAIWRRPLLTDFPVIIPREEQDPELPEKLLGEAPGVLRWCVEGCLEWQREGLRPPGQVMAATERYRLEMDVIAEFLGERCLLDPSVSVWAAALYGSYSAWCEETGERPLKQGDFGRRMTERGFARERGTGGRIRYTGLELASE